MWHFCYCKCKHHLQVCVEFHLNIPKLGSVMKRLYFVIFIFLLRNDRTGHMINHSVLFLQHIHKDKTKRHLLDRKGWRIFVLLTYTFILFYLLCFFNLFDFIWRCFEVEHFLKCNFFINDTIQRSIFFQHCHVFHQRNKIQKLETQ